MLKCEFKTPFVLKAEILAVLCLKQTTNEQMNKRVLMRNVNCYGLLNSLALLHEKQDVIFKKLAERHVFLAKTELASRSKGKQEKGGLLFNYLERIEQIYQLPSSFANE